MDMCMKEEVRMDIKQPTNKERYAFEKYVNQEGFISYFFQVQEALAYSPKNCLVIGQGDDIVPYIMRSQGVEVDTFDIVEDMDPTYLGDVRNIREIVTQKYDVIICCEVLEHIPYEYFEACLLNLKPIANKSIILSLPVFGLAGYIKVWAPKYINFTIPISTRIYKRGCSVMSTEHCWEINSKGYKLNMVRDSIKKVFRIKKQFRVRENPYHMFFILE